MNVLVLIGGTALGLILGSFLNVLISRSPLVSDARGDSPFKGRSYCDSCRKTLAWYELIPLVSFLFLRGKCRSCFQQIPSQYFFVEALVGCIFFGVTFVLLQEAFIDWHSLVRWIFTYCAIFALAGIFLFDFFYEYIPDFLTFLFAASGIILTLLRYLAAPELEDPLLLAGVVVIIFLFFFSLWYFTGGRGMGFGDVKLAPVIPLFVGSALGVAAVMLSFWIGAVLSLLLMALGQKKAKDRIPFGPFLVLGALLCFFFPDAIVGLFSYFSYFH
jgi:leader peptidase (prepilin peptidase)/N-methyltransferase